MNKRDLSEIEIQAQIVEWLNRAIRCRVAAIPNAMHAGNGKLLGRSRREGMSKGAPDLVVWFCDGSEPRTLAIEVKAGRNGLSEEQAYWRQDLIAMGHDYLLARSLDDVIAWFGE